jgi:PKD repeat protein
LKPLPKLSRQKNLQINRRDLNAKGLPGVASTLIVPETQGQGLLGVGKLAPLPIRVPGYETVTNLKGNPVVSVSTVKTYEYLFVQYENTYIPAGDEKLYSFAVVIPLQPMTVNECASQLGVLAKNVTGLTESQYETSSFQHPVYTNQNNTPLVIRYAEVPIVLQTIPGRLDNVPLGYPNFIYSKSPITTQNGPVPSPPLPDFITSQGNTGATAISVGGTVGFVDASVRNPYSWRPTAWSWDFGGTGASAGATGLTAQNPTVSFIVAGTYTVSLTASNANGSNSVTKTNFVTVS